MAQQKSREADNSQDFFMPKITPTSCENEILASERIHKTSRASKEAGTFYL